jgi:hypothetical protein
VTIGDKVRIVARLGDGVRNSMLATRRFALVALAVSLAAPAVASADDSVTVLGMRSLEGDDDFALTLSGALRYAASQVAGWDVSDREISLDQMMLAHGCDEPSTGCMSAVASSLDTQKVIFGTVERVTSGDDFDFAVHIRMFDAGSSGIEGEVSDTIPRVRSDIDQLRARVRRYVDQLAGEVQTGTLVVGANVEGAEVFIDGDSLGFISGGELRADLPAGAPEVEIRAEGYATFSQRVTIDGGGQATVEAVLVEGEGDAVEVGGSVSSGGGLSQSTLGWLFIAGGGVGLVFATVAGLVLDGIGELQLGLDLVGDDERVTAYREATLEGDDFCDRADQNAGSDSEAEYVSGKCSSASTWTAIWWTGLIAGAVLGGVGAFFLLTDEGEENPADAGLVLAPILDEHRAGVSATLSF